MLTALIDLQQDLQLFKDALTDTSLSPVEQRIIQNLIILAESQIEEICGLLG